MHLPSEAWKRRNIKLLSAGKRVVKRPADWSREISEELHELRSNPRPQKILSLTNHNGRCWEFIAEKKLPTISLEIAFSTRKKWGNFLPKQPDEETGLMVEAANWPEWRRQRCFTTLANPSREIWPRSAQCRTLDLPPSRHLLLRSE